MVKVDKVGLWLAIARRCASMRAACNGLSRRRTCWLHVCAADCLAGCFQLASLPDAATVVLDDLLEAERELLAQTLHVVPDIDEGCLRFEPRAVCLA